MIKQTLKIFTDSSSTLPKSFRQADVCKLNYPKSPDPHDMTPLLDEIKTANLKFGREGDLLTFAIPILFSPYHEPSPWNFDSIAFDIDDTPILLLENHSVIPQSYNMTCSLRQYPCHVFQNSTHISVWGT